MQAREQNTYPSLIPVLFIRIKITMLSQKINAVFIHFPKFGNQCLKFSTCIILAAVCCLPVEDERYGCSHDNADTQNDHDHILDV